VSSTRAIRKTLRPVRRILRAASTRLLELPYLLREPPLGSEEWLIRSEVSYGGFVTNVVRRRVSPLDDRTPEQIAFHGMTGGDRMLHHGYGAVYAHFLAPFIGRPGLTIAEFGILKGTGLAIWCDLFSNARMLGFDIDLSHFEENRPRLVRRGAFKCTTPEVHEYDQLVDGSGLLGEILRGAKLDVVIDDGLHSVDAIVKTWRSVRPHLAHRFVYFIEDFENLPQHVGSEFGGFEVTTDGMMTVVGRGTPVGDW